MSSGGASTIGQHASSGDGSSGTTIAEVAGAGELVQSDGVSVPVPDSGLDLSQSTLEDFLGVDTQGAPMAYGPATATEPQLVGTSTGGAGASTGLPSSCTLVSSEGTAQHGMQTMPPQAHGGQAGMSAAVAQQMVTASAGGADAPATAAASGGPPTATIGAAQFSASANEGTAATGAGASTSAQVGGATTPTAMAGSDRFAALSS